MDRDVDTQMLALLLERATGQRYAEWLSSRLWKPLGAGDAWLWLDRPGGTAHAQCCLVARQGDWLRVAELLLSDGQYQGSRILPAGWVGAMRTSARGNRNYGFQVWLGAPYAAQRAYSPLPGAPTSHSEEAYAADDVMFLDGYGKYRLWVVPSLGLAILRTGTDPADRADWDDSRIPNLIIRGVSDRPQSVPGAHVDLSKIVPGH
jgi:CubicO group peptidase (beta-lactamase class C family)